VTRVRHDDKMRAFERDWRRRNGDEDGPHTGPVPDELRAQWDVQAWEPAAPQKRRAHLAGGVRHDPGWAMVSALENFDERTQATRKAAIFSVDVVTPPPLRATADNPQEALAICLGEGRGIDLARIAQLRGLTPDQAREELRGLVFADPDNPDHLIPAPTYLSGNVRLKLEVAEAAVPEHPAMLENVRALRAVIPPDVQAAQITVRPGVTWVPITDLTAFVREILHADQVGIILHRTGRPPRWRAWFACSRHDNARRHPPRPPVRRPQRALEMTVQVACAFISATRRRHRWRPSAKA
jgi:hypothetical protein